MTQYSEMSFSLGLLSQYVRQKIVYELINFLIMIWRK